MGVDTWESAPSTTEGAGWKPDDAGVAVGGWEPDTNGTEDTFTGEFSAENISKHADGGVDGGAADGGCRICGDPAHFQRDCPDKPPNDGLCYNCGEPGHSKAECTNERVERAFTGECRNCGETGHRAADCPTKPPQTCKICKVEGHVASECTANRMTSNFADLGIKDMEAGDAWENLLKADTNKEVDEIKEAILTYAKAFPELTLPELEAVFRESNMNTYLIAKKQEVSDTHTIVNLQGTIDQTYALSIQFSAKPRRKKFAEDGGWPETPEENMTRLAEAGIVMDRMVEKCGNCDQLGHSTRKCPEEKVQKEQAKITCAVCGNDGHRARDCNEARKVPGSKTCKHCGEEGHIAKDCPTKEPEICRNCYQEGHRAKDCENERVMKCRNCDEMGHMSKDCPLPTDWSRVKCSRCGELGHSYKRCKQPAPVVEDAEADGDAGAGGGDWDAPTGGAGDSGGW